MASISDFPLYPKAKTNSHSNLTPLFPSKHSVADQEENLRWNTLYTTIFDNLNTQVTSTRTSYRKTHSNYLEWCAHAPIYLSAFAQTHTATLTARQQAIFSYHERNMAGAVRNAQSRVWGAKHQLSLFIQWANNPSKEVTERDLAECLEKCLSAADQGCEALGREWGMVTPPITPVQSFPKPTPALSALLADLTRSDRDILTSAQAAQKWQTTREKTETWLDAVEEPGIVIDPGEIDEIPLYDVPISDDQIDMMYTKEYTDGYDFDVWEEVQKRYGEVSMEW